MRSKDLKIGQRVAVLSTKDVESYTRVHQYEVLDVRPWASSSRYGRFGVEAPKAPADVTLPEGVSWTSAIRTSPEQGWRASGYGSAPAALLVLVVSDGEGGERYAERPTLISLGQIKGEYETVRREVIATQDVILKRSQDEQEARRVTRNRYDAAVRDAVEAGILRTEYSASQRGSSVTITLDVFERLISDALTLRNRELG